jgi:hypothetical protein
MTDTLDATVNVEPVDTSEVSSESVVDNSNTPTTEPTEPRKSTREVASEAFDKIVEERESGVVTPKKKALPTSLSTERVNKDTDVSGRNLEPIKAPASWTPSLREKWGTVPRDVQEFIQSREKDMSTTLSTTATERKSAKDWNDATSKYSEFCTKYNTTPVAHAAELLNMSQALNTGDPTQRAQILHNLIMHFKPDFSVMQALSQGKPANVTQFQQAQAQPSLDDQVNARLQERQTQEQETHAQSAIDKFASDPQNEFYTDVQQLMGKAIDAGFATGGTTEEVLKKAYDIACQNHPDVKQVLALRGTGNSSKKPIQGIKPSLSSGSKSKVEKRYKTTRDAALAAWDKHVGK